MTLSLVQWFSIWKLLHPFPRGTWLVSGWKLSTQIYGNIIEWQEWVSAEFHALFIEREGGLYRSKCPSDVVWWMAICEAVFSIVTMVAQVIDSNRMLIICTWGDDSAFFPQMLHTIMPSSKLSMKQPRPSREMQISWNYCETSLSHIDLVMLYMVY